MQMNCLMPDSKKNQRGVGQGIRTQQVGTEPDVRGRMKGISRLPEPAPPHAVEKGALCKGPKAGWDLSWSQGEDARGCRRIPAKAPLLFILLADWRSLRYSLSPIHRF